MTTGIFRNFFILFIFLIAGIHTASEAVSVQEEVLYSEPPSYVEPYLSGNNVLYQASLNGTYRLFLVDTETGSSSEIRNNSTNYLYPLDFAGNHISWMDYSGYETAYTFTPVVFDISSETTSEIKSDNSYKEFPAIDNNAIVWADYSHSTSSDTFNEVYYSEISNIDPVRITSVSSYKASLDIDDNIIVWSDYRNAETDTSNGDIFMYNIETETETNICNNPALQDQPDVHGDYIVWQDYRNTGTEMENTDIYLYDIQSGTEKAVCTAPGYQAHPKVYGNYIVWQDYRNTGSDTTNADIFMYDIKTEEEIPVTTAPGYQDRPSIYGSYIVWYDYPENTIYIAEISDSTGISIEISEKKYDPYKGSDLPASYYNLLGKQLSGKERENRIQSIIIKRIRKGQGEKKLYME